MKGELVWSKRLTDHPYLANRLLSNVPLARVVIKDGLMHNGSIPYSDFTDSEEDFDFTDSEEDFPAEDTEDNDALNENHPSWVAPELLSANGLPPNEAEQVAFNTLSSKGPTPHEFQARNENGVTVADFYLAFGQQYVTWTSLSSVQR